MKNNEFEFIAKNEPSKELIEEFHRSLAKSLLNKYGEDFIRETLNEIKKN